MTSDIPAAPQTSARSNDLALTAMVFAVATQWVPIGMAIALALSFVAALTHPGGRVTDPVTDTAAAG